jgi:ParB family chromosome partitioning protein
MDFNKTKKTDILLVDPKNILVTDGFNVRQDMGNLEELADSINSMGVEVPLKAKKVRGEEKYELVDGHRRYAAIQLLLAKGTDIPYVPVQPYTGNEEDRVFSMIITGTGQKSLTELEQAEAIKRLIAFGYGADEIAKKIGKSLPHVYNLMQLANCTKKIKDVIAKGEISGNTVVQIVKQTDDEHEQYEMITNAVSAAKAAGKNKATAKNVANLKTKTPIQKLKDVSNYFADNGITNEKVELLDSLLLNINNATVEELIELLK